MFQKLAEVHGIIPKQGEEKSRNMENVASGEQITIGPSYLSLAHLSKLDSMDSLNTSTNETNQDVFANQITIIEGDTSRTFNNSAYEDSPERIGESFLQKQGSFITADTKNSQMTSQPSSQVLRRSYRQLSTRLPAGPSINWMSPQQATLLQNK